MVAIGPMFKWFGSKWNSSRYMPRPQYETIIEPFAGGAGYSLRNYQKKVYLAEKDAHISNLWRWMIINATQQDILDIPIDVPVGTDIRKLGLSLGQATLMKSWQRTNNVGDCWTVSPWGNKPGQWTANTRARVAEEIGGVKHWEFVEDDGLSLFGSTWDQERVTWYIDPPYQYNYQYYRKNPPIDYKNLANLIKNLEGQVIVSEALCAKTGRIPDWLNFMEFRKTVTSRRKEHESHHSSELLYVRTPLEPSIED